jgi:hypothetical protein
MNVPSETGRCLKHRTRMSCRLALQWFQFLFAGFAASATPNFSIADFVTCHYANTNAPFDWHGPQSVFRIDADKFFAWVELRQVSGKNLVKMELYCPSGTYYGEETQAINETNVIKDWWRMAAWWHVKGEALAQIPGLWKLELIIDGALQRSILLNISSGNSVTSAQTNSMPGSGGPAGGRTIFKATSDPRPADPNTIIGLQNLGGSVERILGLGATNRTYTVQCTTSLQPPVIWTTLGSGTADSTGHWYYDDSAASAPRYYRTYRRVYP